MSNQGAKQNLAGYFKVEVVTKDKKAFEDKYFEISHEEGKLKIYDVDRDYQDKHSVLWKELRLNFISQARDARATRPKAGVCFCITYAGDEYFVQAENVDVMKQWIQELNGASRITVPAGDPSNLKPANSRNEVAGGVIVPVSQAHDSGDESSSSMPALSLPSIYSGYAVKQGGMRKNWKKRYFLLSEKGLQYYKDDQEKEPIKVIPVEDMRRARKVAGEHHPHRAHLFEVITENRTYNIQCETASECDRWVEEINKLVESQPLPYSEEISAPKKAVDTKQSTEHDTKKYTFKTAQQFLNQEIQQVHLRRQNQSQKQQETKRSSNEEETVSSTAVWSETTKQTEVDRKSKTSLKVFSPKNWALW